MVRSLGGSPGRVFLILQVLEQVEGRRLVQAMLLRELFLRGG